MRKVAYSALKLWVKVALFCYYKKTLAVGKEHIPWDKPVMFLSNHQNALMDVLLIVTLCGGKPWFLARSDVFAGAFLQKFFEFLQMLPIYRLRDGRDQLSKNSQIFDQCAELLKNGACIVLFPEANHSLKRRVRPLSKGFTRIVSTTLEKYPDLDIYLVPVGQNYAHPKQVGDSAALYFGRPIVVQQYVGVDNFAMDLKQEAFLRISKLTTHIPEQNYDTVIDNIGDNGPVFLNPHGVNDFVAKGVYPKISNRWRNNFGRLFKTILVVWNLPMILLWRLWIKPRVPEEEFIATFRFGFAFLFYPIFYLLGAIVIWNLNTIQTACLVVMGHAVFNMLLVKLGVTSSSQRK